MAHSRKSKRRSPHKTSRGDDAKIIAYFKRHIRKYGFGYSLGGAWKHPITGNQVRVSDKAERLLKQAKQEMRDKVHSKKSSRKSRSHKRSRSRKSRSHKRSSRKWDEVNCRVKRSPTNDKKDLIKEIRAYANCWEKATGTNQDMSLERLRGETVSELKKHLKWYRSQK